MEGVTSEISAVIVTVIFLGFLRWAIIQFRDMMREFAIVIETSIKANTKVTEETYEYLKNRNGSLERNDREIMKALDKVSRRLDK